MDAAGRPVGAPKVVRGSPFHESTAAISHDGRWVAYESDELDGVVQVYVRSWPDGAHKVRASAAGARLPAWGPNGELYYWQTGDDMLRVMHTTENGGPAVVGTAEPVWRGTVDRRRRAAAPRHHRAELALRRRSRRRALPGARERSRWFRSGALTADDRPRVGDAAALIELTMRDGEQYVPAFRQRGEAMTYTRKNVWGLGSDWADEILWYARGVKAMKARALAEPTSWRFYGAIHGLYPPLWQQYGYLSSSDQMPDKATIKRFWLSVSMAAGISCRGTAGTSSPSRRTSAPP